MNLNNKRGCLIKGSLFFLKKGAGYSTNRLYKLMLRVPAAFFIWRRSLKYGKRNRVKIPSIVSGAGGQRHRCPPNGACHKSKGNRVIEINYKLRRLKEQAQDLLLNEEGIKKRKQRCHNVESVLENIKNNHGFKRWILRGKEKVAIEAGLLAPTQNLKKKAAWENGFNHFLKILSHLLQVP